MIVDDEQYIRQSYMFYFEDRCWEVSSAESGEQALKKLVDLDCNAAVVDIRMGEMDGESFIRNALKQFPKMVFVICTGSPVFNMSKDLSQNPRVSNQIFTKPDSQIKDLEDELINLLSS